MFKVFFWSTLVTKLISRKKLMYSCLLVFFIEYSREKHGEVFNKEPNYEIQKVIHLPSLKIMFENCADLSTSSFFSQ